MEMNIYLYFNGNCEEAMNFYKEALGGNIESIMHYGDAPMPCSDSQKSKVMHAVMLVAGTTMMFSDSSEQRKVTQGDNFAVSLGFKSEEEITTAYNAISAGGNVTMPLQDTFWGAKFGMCCDKFGVNWMFNWDKPKA
jgi:PhnB protein